MKAIVRILEKAGGYRRDLHLRIEDLLAQNRIPSLDQAQMSDFLHGLFTSCEKTIRVRIAEIVYCYDHDNPHAFNIFLACTVPLAEKAARRRADRLFVHPSDWQLESMYNGAVEAVITVFQTNSIIAPGTGNFRRYLYRAMALGALRSYFRRGENDGVRAVADLAAIPSRKLQVRSHAEQDVITRDLLNRVTSFPNLRPTVSATLACIRALGPDVALKEHAYTASGDPDKWKRDRDRRPILNPIAIAEAMGTDRYTVHTNLREARIILRSVFNADGKLFLSH
ncbi:MAG: hypothetical protein ABSD59_16745 [Terracidiphilus sp.]|jgi:hypothetical protein